MSEKTEVAKVEAKLPALPDPDELREILAANFEGIKPSFEVVKIPTGGGLAWTVPTEGEEPDMVKELQGVILDHYATRVYWREKFGQGSGNQPPTCFSLDGKTGSLPRQSGEFGDCPTCKWSQFGTATKQDGTGGRGQACSLKHRVFLLVPERSIFPFMIPLSTMSSEKKYEGSFSTYAVKLGSRLKKLGDVVTKVKLAKDRNADGIEYAKAQFFYVADLSNEEKTKVASLKQMFASAMRARPIDVEEGGSEEWEEKKENGATEDGRDPWEK